MNDQNNIRFLIRTNYFTRPGTWVLRFVQFSIALFVLYVVDLSEMADGSQVLYVCGVLLAIGFLFVPVDEFALDDTSLYFIKKSFIPFLNRTKQYKISEIKKIGFYAMPHAPSVFSLFVPVTNAFRVEFIFKDDSSHSDDLFIHRKDLQEIVSAANRLLLG